MEYETQHRMYEPIDEESGLGSELFLSEGREQELEIPLFTSYSQNYSVKAA